MEEKIRSLLYEGSGLRPLFNPMEAKEDAVPSPLVIDMTVDIANHGRVYHTCTDEVRGLLAEAQAVVCDTERMAQVAKQYSKGLVVTAPFGWTTYRDRETAFTIGLLNHSEEQQVTNKQLRKFLKSLKQPFLAYGPDLDWADNGDNTSTQDWEYFCSQIDVLLLVGTEHVIPSLALPLSAMMSGAVILATGHYHILNPASGVMIMPTLEQKIWNQQLKGFEQNLRRLDSLKQFNIKYAKQLSKESQSLIFRLARRLT